MMKTWAWAMTGVDLWGRPIERKGSAFTYDGAFADLEDVERQGITITRSVVARVLPGELRLPGEKRA